LNKKSAIVSIVLIAVMCGFLLPAQVKAFQTPAGSNPGAYNYYGPAPSTLLIDVFPCQGSTFTALTSGSIDMMDSLLTLTQYAGVKGNPAITTGSVAQTELVEYDLNNWCAPFNNTVYRQAFSYMINRTDFLTTYYTGSGTPCYDPLDFNPYGRNSGGIPVEAYCRALYVSNYPYALAYQAFMESGYSEHLEDGTNGLPNIPGYFTWFFASPFPTTSSGTPAGTPPGALAIPNATIQIFYTAYTLWGTAMCQYMMALCGSTTSSFTTWVKNNYNDPTYASLFAEYPLPTVNGVPQFPMINFMGTSLITVTATDANVNTYYRFQMFTGSWNLDEFMDGLEIWQSYYTPQAENWGPLASNYDDWYDANYNATAGIDFYDLYVTNALTASISGLTNPSSHGGSMYWADLAEIELMSQAPFIPFFYPSGYSAILTQDNFAINETGTGFDNWFTYMDAQTPTGTLTWGWTSPVLNPNPISSTSAWDWYMMDAIYDPMLRLNPYNMTIIPALATNYTVVSQDPNNPFNPPAGSGIPNDTSAYLQLRNDVFWQDVPGMTRTSYTYNDGSQLNGPFTDMALTPADVAFTYEYLTHDGLYQSFHLAGQVWDVGQVEISSVYRSLFTPYQTTYNNVKEWSAYNPDGTVASTATPVYVNNVPGYTWENITYIMSTGVLNGSEAGVNAFVNTGNPFQPSNFIAFNPTLSPYQLVVNFMDTTGWFVEPFELSIPIIPMFIWANLAEASWPNSAWPTGCPSSFTMVLGPITGGADLLYGSGPYIWVSGTAPPYTLEAYVTGISYGGVTGVTEDTSYWAAQVREPDVYAPSNAGLPPSDNFDLQPFSVSQNGLTTPENSTDNWIPILCSVTLLNLGTSPVTTTVTFTLRVKWPGLSGMETYTGTATPTIVSGGTTSTVTYNFAKVQVANNAPFLYYSLTISDGKGGMFAPNPSNSLWYALTPNSLVPLRFPWHLPGDVLGLGVVNIKAGALVGANWGLNTPYGSPPGNANPLADINGDGVVNIKDGAIIGAEWGLTFVAIS
jgi:ABC-type transport system substrate-binding protein